MSGMLMPPLVFWWRLTLKSMQLGSLPSSTAWLLLCTGLRYIRRGPGQAIHGNATSGKDSVRRVYLLIACCLMYTGTASHEARYR